MCPVAPVEHVNGMYVQRDAHDMATSPQSRHASYPFYNIHLMNTPSWYSRALPSPPHASFILCIDSGDMYFLSCRTLIHTLVLHVLAN
ncbi:hypothetical protein LOAG_03405 [Loa loa]|uniref:Uncharacterized protein n=1 Tax=Loa loa TaxID=7209 RepID=A0A1S0U4S2_LOALO|nr:hypothetical protein LOAG_03405 [Loa loa]EFO25083.2 hypothetical protein LOAG_03405 [Loa loa]